MYGLPKTHKPKDPLRPILSTTGSVHLASLLQPVLDRYRVQCISVLFTFADYIRKLGGQIDSFIRPFDESTLFTNVLLDETIMIRADTLYDNPDSHSKEVFVKLLRSATNTFEFGFDNTVYRQIVGVAMGSTFGSTLANIFVGY